MPSTASAADRFAVDISHGADVVVGRKGLKTMRDLQGKSVAVESSALGAFVLSRALTLNGMQAGDVNVVHLESNEQTSAFEKGQVDGAVTFDPYRAQFLQAGATTLFDSTQIPGEIVDLLAVRATASSGGLGGPCALNGWFDADRPHEEGSCRRRTPWDPADVGQASRCAARAAHSVARDNTDVVGAHPEQPSPGAS